jgi:hypothetical protein
MMPQNMPFMMPYNIPFLMPQKMPLCGLVASRPSLTDQVTLDGCCERLMNSSASGGGAGLYAREAA